MPRCPPHPCPAALTAAAPCPEAPHPQEPALEGPWEELPNPSKTSPLRSSTEPPPFLDEPHPVLSPPLAHLTGNHLGPAQGMTYRRSFIHCSHLPNMSWTLVICLVTALAEPPDAQGRGHAKAASVPRDRGADWGCRAVWDQASQERWQVWEDEAGFSGRPSGLQLWALVGRTGLLGSGNKLGGRSGLCHDSTKEARGPHLI